MSLNSIQLAFNISEDYALKSVVFMHNDTDLPSDSELIKNLAIAMLKSLHLNKDSVAVQDLLNELNTPTNPPITCQTQKNK